MSESSVLSMVRGIRKDLGSDESGTSIPLTESWFPPGWGAETTIERRMRAWGDLQPSERDRVNRSHPRFGWASCILIHCNNAEYGIGTDKLGHMFQQGYMLFELATQLSVIHARAFSAWTEGLYDEKRFEPAVTEWLNRELFEFYGFPKDDPLSEYEKKWGGSYWLARSTGDIAANSAGLAFYLKVYEAITKVRMGGQVELPAFNICDYNVAGFLEPVPEPPKIEIPDTPERHFRPGGHPLERHRRRPRGPYN